MAMASIAMAFAYTLAYILINILWIRWQQSRSYFKSVCLCVCTF